MELHAIAAKGPHFLNYIMCVTTTFKKPQSMGRTVRFPRARKNRTRSGRQRQCAGVRSIVPGLEDDRNNKIAVPMTLEFIDWVVPSAMIAGMMLQPVLYIRDWMARWEESRKQLRSWPVP
jgi:hypothetical protein